MVSLGKCNLLSVALTDILTITLQHYYYVIRLQHYSKMGNGLDWSRLAQTQLDRNTGGVGGGGAAHLWPSGACIVSQTD